jgi:hypothetical protein
MRRQIGVVMQISRAKAALFLVWVSGCQPHEYSLDQGAQASCATETCCGGLGLCAPEGFVSPADAERLGHADCHADTLWCVPVVWMEDPSRGPSPCRAPGDLEGRCLPGCLPELQPRAAQLSQQSCEAGNLCVPCFDPYTGHDTHACSFELDSGPSEPPAERLIPPP